MKKEYQNSRILLYYLLILVTGFSFFVACAKPVMYHGKEVGGHFNLLTTQDEESLGEEVAIEIDYAMPILYDPEITQYIQSVGYRLTNALEKEGQGPLFRYEFKVINDDVINAFALPGGFIYVHRGLLEKVENESEIAGLLAHEIGHAWAHHGARIWSKMILISGIAIAVEESIPEKNKKWKAVAAIAGGFTIVFTQLKYSRDMEREADFVGVHLMTEAGYNPDGMVTLFQKFDKLNHADPHSFQTFFSTHPTPAERIVNTEKEINSVTDKSQLTVTTQNFSSMKQDLSKLPHHLRGKRNERGRTEDREVTIDFSGMI